MASSDMLVPMLQISIALGILYIGLQTARYRNRIYQGIVTTILARTGAVEASVVASPRYKDHSFGKSRLNDANQRVQMWLHELPIASSSELEGTVADAFLEASEPDATPCLYRWFQEDWDRWTVFFLSSVVPILLCWELVYPVEYMTDTRTLYYAAFGQVFVGLHVLVGWSMSWYFRWRFEAAVKTIVSEVAALETRESLGEFGS